MSALHYIERPPSGEAQGLLVLHHGRGSDEHDLLTLADVLDPRGRLHIVTARAPLELPGSAGFHWYLVPRVGYPDPATFESSRTMLAELHDELWQRTGIGPERTVLGGFSMGCVMSHAMSLSAERPVPAGILGYSGFIPTVAGWQPALGGRSKMRAFIAHGSRDRVIDVAFGRAAAELLGAAGVEVSYHESEIGHHIDPRGLPDAAAWLELTL